MCGIWGFNGKKDRKVDPKKLLVLGLYNRTRGTDSCGYYYNGNIVKGVGAKADFMDFVIDHRFLPGELPGETVMAHARKSTSGANTEVNAHPHQVHNLVQTHNGGIKNIWELCRKHGVDHTGLHVDSLGLATIIQKDGFGVLNEYEGFAALTHVFMDDPLSLYLYHGASREKAGETIYEERPLYYLQTAEGLYYSSMENALKMINTTKNQPQQLYCNAVYRLQYGEIIDSVFKVDRADKNLPKVYIHTPTQTTYQSTPKSFPNEIPFRGQTQPAATGTNRNLILYESDPPERSSQDVYYKYGRHHKAEFVCVKDSKTGSCFESHDVLLNGVYNIDRKGIIHDDANSSEFKCDTYYFIRGVMCKDKDAYDAYFKETNQPDLRYNVAVDLSKVSRYPVTCYFDEAHLLTPQYRARWYSNGKLYDGEFDVKFTKRQYVIKNNTLDLIKRPGDAPSVFDMQDIVPVFSRKVYVDGVTEEVLEADIVDDTNTYVGIYKVIEVYADKIIKDTEVEELPECFLLFLEAYAKECAAVILDEKGAFNETVLLLTELIQNKRTLLEEFRLSFEPDGYLTVQLVEKYLKDYTPAELQEMPNRYTLQPFELIEKEDLKKTEKLESSLDKLETAPVQDTLPETLPIEPPALNAEGLQTKKEREEALVRLALLEKGLEQLDAEADELQALNTSDPAQNIAFATYTFKKSLQDVINKERLRLEGCKIEGTTSNIC